MSSDESASEPCETIEVTWRGETREGPYREGSTVFDAALDLGFWPSVSCSMGNCGACMAKLTEGTVMMKVNYVLTQQELEQGYILTCQALPTSRRVAAVFET